MAKQTTSDRRRKRRLANRRAQKTTDLIDAAIAHHKAHRFEAAGVIYQGLLKIRPDDSEILNALASVRKALCDPEESQKLFLKAIEYNSPPAPIYHFNYANLLQALDDREQAYEHYLLAIEEAHRSQPELVEDFQSILANEYATHQEPAKAEAIYRDLLEVKPGNGMNLHNLAGVLVLQRRAEEALELYLESFKKENHPCLDESLHAYGNALTYLGRNKEAVEVFREVAPRLTRAYYNIVRIKEKLTPVEVMFLRGAANAPQDEILKPARGQDLVIDDVEKSFMYFALAEHYDQSGIYGEAYHYLMKANASFRVDFIIEDHEKDSNKVMNVFSKALFDRGITSNSKARPIFVLGMPRSGTTLVEQILSSHTKVFGGGEILAMNDLTLSIDKYPGALVDYTPEQLDVIADHYLGLLFQNVDEEGIELVVDKLPQNFLMLGLIALVFPNAVVVHCQRHPLDTILSCLFQPFYGCNFAFDIEILGRYYLKYEQMMDHWRTVLPLNIIDVQYETLVSQPEEEIRRLVGACGLEWQDACLSHHKNKRAVYTSSFYQARQPVYKTSVARWRNYDPYLDEVKGVLGDWTALRNVPGSPTE